jgi:hypothetical protein
MISTQKAKGKHVRAYWRRKLHRVLKKLPESNTLLVRITYYTIDPNKEKTDLPHIDQVIESMDTEQLKRAVDYLLTKQSSLNEIIQNIKVELGI